ncbi:hypothetical protein GSI_08529 [Ganoderma sinense ZZ0214-1]|uniref:Uncharacterized protein n=1 Tax=Ganoderma sinense ZZ0214-1 TaxID=1077348 RepID=A0A2G8S403_9APHY|nr:hypothetical protein GSI_08529 [Ganoderma sinense ZZ0214-1]
MPLVDHGWGYSNGNVVDTVTYGHSDPWYTHTYAYTWSSQAVTLPSDGTGQAQADTTRATSTTTHAVAAPSPTRSPTQSPTSTTPAASQASTTPPTAHATSLADEGMSASASGSGGGVSHSSGASFGIITGTPSPAITQALAGSSSSSTGEAAPTGPSRNLTARGMGTGATVGIVLAMAPLTVGLVGVFCFAWRRRRRGQRRRESSFMQYPFLWRRDAASTATTSEVLTPPRAPAEWHTFRHSEAAESACATATTATMVTSGNGGGAALNDKLESERPPVAVGHPLRFSPAFPQSSPILPSPPPTTPASVRESHNPTALAAPPAVHETDADQPPSPASTLLHADGYPWDHLPRPGRRASFGTVSVSYSNAMTDSEVGSRPQSYSRY